MQSIYDGNTLTEALSIKKFNGFLYHWQSHQFGVWMLLDKSTQSIVGYCVFRYFEEENSELNGQVELGYILDEPFWGNGYATEAVSACIRIGFEYHHFNNKHYCNNFASKHSFSKSHHEGGDAA